MKVRISGTKGTCSNSGKDYDVYVELTVSLELECKTGCAVLEFEQKNVVELTVEHLQLVNGLSAVISFMNVNIHFILNNESEN